MRAGLTHSGPEPRGTPVDVLNLPPGTRHALHGIGVSTLGDLIEWIDRRTPPLPGAMMAQVDAAWAAWSARPQSTDSSIDV